MDMGACGLITLARALDFQDFEKLWVTWLPRSRAKENNNGRIKHMAAFQHRKEKMEGRISMVICI